MKLNLYYLATVDPGKLRVSADARNLDSLLLNLDREEISLNQNLLHLNWIIGNAGIKISILYIESCFVWPSITSRRRTGEYRGL